MRTLHPTKLCSIFTLAMVFCVSPLWSQSQGDEDAKPQLIVLSDGLPVHLLLMDDLQGKKLQIKQVIHWKVREDLTADSRVVVRAGTEAIGHIDSISKSGLLGKSGKLVVQFDFVTSTSGAKVSLRGGASLSGGKGGALTWESALWFGPDANLPVGTKINAFVKGDQKIALASEPADKNPTR